MVDKPGPRDGENWGDALNASLDALEAACQRAASSHLGASDPHGDRAFAESHVTDRTGVPGGLCPLDANGKVPARLLPDGANHSHHAYELLAAAVEDLRRSLKPCQCKPGCCA